MKTTFYKLLNIKDYGTIVKVEQDKGTPQAFRYNKKTEKWDTDTGFFFEYFADEPDNYYEEYEELSTEEAKKYTTDYVEEALLIAKKAHKGQVDRAGVDYINHPIYVASLMTNDDTRAAALLHDTIEDTDVTAEYLLDNGIPKDIVDAVVLLTNDNQDYLTYVKGLKSNFIARAVKIGDLTHNSDLTRLPKITERDRKRKELYAKALDILKG